MESKKKKIPSISHWPLNTWVHTHSKIYTCIHPPPHTVKNTYKQNGIVMVYAMILESGRKASN